MSDHAEAALFEAVITPHRSLSAAARRRLIAAIAAVCALDAIVFTAIGAWPVGGFAGVELLAAAVLIRVNTLAGRADERLLLADTGLRILRTSAKGARSEVALSPAWLTVTLEERPGRVPKLLLTGRDVREEIGASLGEVEKRDLAEALRDALHRWRHPTFDNPQLA